MAVIGRLQEIEQFRADVEFDPVNFENAVDVIAVSEVPKTTLESDAEIFTYKLAPFAVAAVYWATVTFS